MTVQAVLGRTRRLPAQLQALSRQLLPGRPGDDSHIYHPELISRQEEPMRPLGLADESRNKTSDRAPDNRLTARGQTCASKLPEGAENLLDDLLRLS